MIRNNVGFIFHLIFYAMQRCLIGSLLVMKRGVFNTTRKQNDRACSGKYRIHLGRKKARMSRSQVKTMLVCFFDHKGIVHYEFIAQGQTVNQQCYLEVLTSLRKSVRRKRPGLWPDNWILQHDHASAHYALRFPEFLAKNYITNMDHPPYSPDLAPCDIWLFPKLKNVLKRQRFADFTDILRNVKTLLRGIPEDDFQDCFWQWHHHLTKCIAHKKSISKATEAGSAEVTKFCFHRAIPGIKLSHHVLPSEASLNFY